MKWSLQIAKFAGIPVRIHVTFLLIVAWVAYAHYQQDPDPRAVGMAVLFLLVIFGIIVVHEFSHALVARSFGIRTSDITLWPIGGVSNLERMPENPRQEFLIAIAGPSVNIVLAMVLGAFIVLTSGAEALFQFDLKEAFLPPLVWVNVGLAVFNLLPAFPMDGGRALRALLAMVMDRVRATQLAAAAGKGMALVFAMLGLAVNPFLVLIAVFIWLGATAETAHAEVKAALNGHPVGHAMTTSLTSVHPGDPLGVPARLLISTTQRVFPVVLDGQVLGVLSELGLLQALAQHGAMAPLGDHVVRDLVAVSPSDPLLKAYEVLQRGDVCCVLVEEHGRLVGVVTRAGISAFLTIVSALRGKLPGVATSGERPLVGSGSS